ncbi:MAG: helix-turn-helix domain-containing protein [Anaerovoracaceae bacterium]|jgi:DNA-binding CsgD family transcriptional regulator
MFPHFIFISYIIMICIGLLGISLVAVLLKLNKSNNNSRLFYANKNFIIVALGLAILYFITYYSDFVIGDYNTSRLYRLIDGMMFYALGLSWVKVLDSFADPTGENLINLRKITNKIFIPLMIISSLAYGFLIDGYYNAIHPLANPMMVIFELALVFTVLLFTIIYLRKCNLKRLDKASRHYLFSICLFVNVINIWNSIVVLAIFVGFIQVSLLTTYSYGFTALFLMIVNGINLLYVYKIYGVTILEDISMESSANISMEPEADISINLEEKTCTDTDTTINVNSTEIVEEIFKLTKRESEVMELAYHGLTNPEIAEELFISKHTVKRHMHNIFEKMNVSTRVEMVHLVNSTMNRESSN